MFRTSDIVYYVNEEKRTVVAVATGMEYDALEEIDKVCSSMFGDRPEYPIPVVFSKAILPDTMKAKAKCSPNDEWDEEIGKRVAKMKLVNHYNKVKSRVLREYTDKMEEFVDRMNCLSCILSERSQQPIEF